MAEPFLELASYEMPPRHAPNMDGEPFSVQANCFGEERTVVGRIINDDGYCNFLFFGLPDAPERGHFVCARGGDAAYQLENLCWAGNEHEVLIESLANQQWGRYFVLNSRLKPTNGHDAVYTLFLCSTGKGQLISPRPNIAHFQWSLPCARAMWDTPPLELLQQVISSKGSTDEVEFAFRYANMTHSEHLELAFPLHRGSYKQWNEVCQSYALALDLWEERWENHALEFSVGAGGRVTAFWSTNQGATYKLDETSKFHKFVSWSYRHFCPIRNTSICQRYPYMEEWITWENSFIKGSLVRPTQHERLEAMLYMRDWLADKATPLEIELLLNNDYN